MKKLYLILISVQLLFIYPTAFGQKHDCILSADNLIGLIRANNDVVEDILFPCFKVIYPPANDTIKKTFRRDYLSENKLHSEYDLIQISVNGNVSFATNSVATYETYKSKLKNYGFQYVADDEAGSKYVFEKYRFYTMTSKNKDGSALYTITISRK